MEVLQEKHWSIARHCSNYSISHSPTYFLMEKMHFSQFLSDPSLINLMHWLMPWRLDWRGDMTRLKCKIRSSRKERQKRACCDISWAVFPETCSSWLWRQVIGSTRNCWRALTRIGIYQSLLFKTEELFYHLPMQSVIYLWSSMPLTNETNKQTYCN